MKGKSGFHEVGGVRTGSKKGIARTPAGTLILFYLQNANCWRPRLHGLTTMANSIYNSWRFEDLWLDN